MIALVDDDPMWRFLTSTALQGFGWTVEDHDSGQALIDALPRSAADIILIDAIFALIYMELDL